MELAAADLTKFQRDGWLVLPRVISNTEVAAIDRAVDAVGHWASHGGPGLHHFEATDWGPVLARVMRQLIGTRAAPAAWDHL